MRERKRFTQGAHRRSFKRALGGSSQPAEKVHRRRCEMGGNCFASARQFFQSIHCDSFQAFGFRLAVRMPALPGKMKRDFGGLFR